MFLEETTVNSEKVIDPRIAFLTTYVMQVLWEAVPHQGQSIARLAAKRERQWQSRRLFIAQHLRWLPGYGWIRSEASWERRKSAKKAAPSGLFHGEDSWAGARGIISRAGWHCYWKDYPQTGASADASEKGISEAFCKALRRIAPWLLK